MKYTFSDDEDDEGYSDSTTRRSTRNTGTHTPAEPIGPTVTLSGRQVKSRTGGTYGESMLSGTQTPATTGTAAYDAEDDGEDEDEDGDIVDHRSRHAAAQTTNGIGRGGRHIEGYNSVDEMDDEDDASEQDYGDDDEEEEEAVVESDVDDQDVSEDDIDMDADDNEVAESGKKHLLVKLKVKTPTPEKVRTVKLDLESEPNGKDLNGSGTSPITENPKPSTTNDMSSIDVEVTRSEVVVEPETTNDKSETSQPAATTTATPLSPSLEPKKSDPAPTVSPLPIDV